MIHEPLHSSWRLILYILPDSHYAASDQTSVFSRAFCSRQHHTSTFLFLRFLSTDLRLFQSAILLYFYSAKTSTGFSPSSISFKIFLKQNVNNIAVKVTAITSATGSTA